MFKFRYITSVHHSNCTTACCSVAKLCPTLQPHELAACQASLSFTICWNLLKPMSTELVMPSNHLILCCPFLPPSVFPRTRVFSRESVLCIRWPSTGSSASASVLPMNIQDWFPLGWTGGISLQSRDSQESSSTPQLKSINSSRLRLLYSPTLTCIHDPWKKHSLDQMDLCWQSNVSAFSYAI